MIEHNGVPVVLRKDWREFMPKIHPCDVANLVMSGQDIKFCTDPIIRVGEKLYWVSMEAEKDKVSGAGKPTIGS